MLNTRLLVIRATRNTSLAYVWPWPRGPGSVSWFSAYTAYRAFPTLVHLGDFAEAFIQSTYNHSFTYGLKTIDRQRLKGPVT